MTKFAVKVSLSLQIFHAGLGEPLYWWLSVLLEVMQQGLPGFAEAESPISVNVIWMHLNFDGFSDETIHVAGFC